MEEPVLRFELMADIQYLDSVLFYLGYTKIKSYWGGKDG